MYYCLFAKVHGPLCRIVCVCVCVCPSEALQKEKTEKQEQWLQQLDDEEYDALPEEEKEQIVERYRENLRQRKLRYWKMGGLVCYIFVFLSQNPLSPRFACTTGPSLIRHCHLTGLTCHAWFISASCGVCQLYLRTCM